MCFYKSMMKIIWPYDPRFVVELSTNHNLTMAYQWLWNGFRTNNFQWLHITVSYRYITLVRPNIIQPRHCNGAFHDDVIKWKTFPRHWPFVRGIQQSPVNSPHKGQWRGALMFSLICAWINSWINNCEAGDLRHHRAHYDVIGMHLNNSCYWLPAWPHLYSFSEIMRTISDTGIGVLYEYLNLIYRSSALIKCFRQGQATVK